MPDKFPIAEIISEARKLPLGDREHQLVVDDFHGSQIVSENHLSPQACEYLEVFGPILDAHMDLSRVPKAYHSTYRLAAAATMKTVVDNTRKSEATLASTSLPTFTRQKLMLVTRLFPSLIAPQLFGFLPMAGPTARIQFLRYQYGSNHVTSTPNIAVGDAVDDPAKQNAAYANHTENTAAKTVTFKYLDMDISVQDKRVVGEWSDRLSDEASAVYGDNAESRHLDICGQLLGFDIDRNLIAAALAAVPGANTDTFDATPAGYTSLTPSEKAFYDQELYRTGFTSVLNKIAATCRLNPEGRPNWVLTDINGIGLIRRIQGFTSLNVDIDSASIGSGPVMAGSFNDIGLRVFVDQSFNAGDTTEAEFLFGRRPTGMEAAIYLGMWIPAKVTPAAYNPETGQTVKGVRSSYAIADPDTNDEAESAELARCYGKLTVTL